MVFNLNSTTQMYIYEIKERISNYLKTKHSIYENNRIIEPIEEMDELYYARPEHNEGSDNVFITPHIDGFWMDTFYALWRCIFCVKNPSDTITHFPFRDKSLHSETMSLFVHDYNRTFIGYLLLHFLIKKQGLYINYISMIIPFL